MAGAYQEEIRDRRDNEEHGLKTKQGCISYFLAGPKAECSALHVNRPGGIGKPIWIRARWVSTRNEPGPWSLAQNTVIA